MARAEVPGLAVPIDRKVAEERTANMSRNLKYVQDEVSGIQSALEVLDAATRHLEASLEIVDVLLKDPTEPSALGATAYRRALQQLRMAATATAGAQNCLTERLDARKMVLSGAHERDRSER